MLVISKRQMAHFAQASTEAFLERTDLHLREWFPHHCESVDKEQMRTVILRGWQKANSYQMTSEACVRSYLEFMCLLGSDFDTDTLLPWAAEILNENCVDCEFSRGDRLHEKAWAYARNVSRDYQGLAAFSPAERANATIAPRRTEALVLSVKASLQKALPTMCSYVSDETLLAAVSHCVESFSIGYGATSERAATLFATTRFLFGAAFDKDPFLPWASAALNDPAITSANTRVDNLYAAGVSFLARLWKLSAVKGRP